jgi:hypothetical protein
VDTLTIIAGLALLCLVTIAVELVLLYRRVGDEAYSIRRYLDNIYECVRR